jgi:hypothetical protein
VNILNLKERGHQYQEEGVKLINLIANQMNNNRLSTNKKLKTDKDLIVSREQLYVEINKLLNGPSNIEMRDGRPFILSLNKFYKVNVKTKVQIKDINNLVLGTFDSLSDCAKYLGVSQPTVKNRLVKNQLFVFDNKSCYIKLINKYNDSDLPPSDLSEDGSSCYTKKIKINSKFSLDNKKSDLLMCASSPNNSDCFRALT